MDATYDNDLNDRLQPWIRKKAVNFTKTTRPGITEIK
jgi:hypothetical protein